MASLSNSNADSVFLDKNVRPQRYDLTWDVDLDSLIISAHGTIFFEIEGDGVQVLTLHALDLNIDRGSVTWTSSSGEVRTLKSAILNNAKEQTVSFPFGGEPLKGKGSLSLKWNFVLTDNLCGFYRSKYVDIDGTEKVMAVTQFEATDARRAFPCVDEPSAKAAFNVTLIVPSDRIAISNMPVAKKNTVASGKRAVYT